MSQENVVTKIFSFSAKKCEKLRRIVVADGEVSLSLIQYFLLLPPSLLPPG
jgi:hypothetical protein